MPTLSETPRARPVVMVVAETASTQDDLFAAVVAEPDSWGHLSGIRAQRQISGRGRGDRVWDTRNLHALTVSLLLRPSVPRESWPWVPMLTGLAVVRALHDRGIDASVKWPNDVVVPALGEHAQEIDGWGTWRKLAGVLAQVQGEGAIVVGIGVNLDGSPPVPWATTVAAALGAGLVGAAADGPVVDAAEVLEEIRAHLREALVSDPLTWRGAVENVCATLGTRVRVHLPGGVTIAGEANRLDVSGALVVRRDDGGESVVMAGDVDHCRAAPKSER